MRLQLLLVLLIFFPLAFSAYWNVSSQADFNLGTYSNTFYNTLSSSVTLSPAFSSGYYVSQIFDATTPSLWQTISWTPGGFYGIALPNNQSVESGIGAVNMSDNVLLFHLDEISGPIIDSSDLGNSGSYSGSLYSSPAIFNTGLGFTGSENISVSNSPTILVSPLSLEAWVNASTPNWLNGWRFRKLLNVTEQSGTTLTEFQVLIILDTQQIISQGKLQPNCADLRFTDSSNVLLPYWIEYGCNTNETKIWVQFPSLPASSTTSFYMYYGNPSATSASDDIEVFSYSSPQPIFYVVSQRAGGQIHRIISYADGNVVDCDGTVFTLNNGSIGTCTPSWGGIISATKPIAIDSSNDADTSPVPISFAGKQFIYRMARATDYFSVYSPFSAAQVGVYENGVLLTSVVVPQNTAQLISQNIVNGRTVEIVSNVSVLVTHHGLGGVSDGFIFYPSSYDYIGVPSNQLQVAVGNSLTNVTVYYSTGTVNSYLQNPYTNFAVSGLGSQGAAPSAYVTFNTSLGAPYQFADGDGSESSTFISLLDLNTQYWIPSNWQYVAVASPYDLTCSLYDSAMNPLYGSPLSATKACPDCPTKLCFDCNNGGGGAAGAYLSCNAPAFAYFEETGFNEETNLWGPKQMRKFAEVAPTYSFGDEEPIANIIYLKNSYGLGTNSSLIYGFVNDVVVTAPISSGWQHVVLTYDLSTISLYVNGSLVASQPYALPVNGSASDLLIGRFFNGTLDEVAIYNRSLSASEILDHYKRGILSLNVSVRSCDDPLCSGDPWIDIPDISPQPLTIPDSQYIQFAFNFSTDFSLYSPELFNVSVQFSQILDDDNEPRDSLKDLDVSIFSLCESILLNITSSQESVDSANILILDPLTNYPYATSKTNSSGLASFDLSCGRDLWIKISKPGFYSESFIYNFECNNQCEPQGCLTDNDCAGNEYCNIPNGELVGSCEPVTGECGYAENHQWINYECCSDSDCPIGYGCENNLCVVLDYFEPSEDLEENVVLEEKEAPQNLSEEIVPEKVLDKKANVTEPAFDKAAAVKYQLDLKELEPMLSQFYLVVLLLIVIIILQLLLIALHLYTISKLKKN